MFVESPERRKHRLTYMSPTEDFCHPRVGARGLSVSFEDIFLGPGNIREHSLMVHKFATGVFESSNLAGVSSLLVYEMCIGHLSLFFILMY
jgi:hypothetical protein